MVEPAEIFKKLECNDTQVIESAKAEIYSLIQNVKDSWVINGLYDYYLNSNSIRCMEVLANINEPHHKYLFDKLTESIKRQETELKVKALTLLGHIVRKQPTWIYRICEHQLMREILSLLKNEGDVLVLISALLLIIVLLPIIPSLIAHHLQDLFEIFSRLAAWNLGTGAIPDKQIMIHMQISLYALFLRLYGMYPCNFITYLRSSYKEKTNPVFVHTIQPMLETVRLHPEIVTATKDTELLPDRWKTISADQVIVECEQFHVDVAEKCPHDCLYISTGFRSRSGTANSRKAEEPKFVLEQLNEICIQQPTEQKPFFSPSYAFPDRLPSSMIPTNFHYAGSSSQEGTSPPEAAIEATPETTPVRDNTRPSVSHRPPHIASSVVRGLTSFTKNRSVNTTPTHSQPSSPMRKDNVSPFHFPSSGAGTTKRESITNQKLQKLFYERSQSAEIEANAGTSGVAPINVPSSPVKIVGPSDSSRRNESPLSVEDEEVKAIVAQNKDVAPSSPRKCDSVLHEDANVNIENNGENNTFKQGSPCSQGGLHMPNSRSINDFAKRVHRLRFYSQNYDKDPVGKSTGSSPGQGALDGGVVKRTNSCPDMKKKSPVAAKANRVLKKTEEEKCTSHRETQTEDMCMPYEHLFLNIFPSLGINSDVKPSPSPSPMPLKPFGNKEAHHSAHSILDRYIETSKGDVSSPAAHIQLLNQQLLFERHRREVFAARNRKLLADAKNIKALEEYNSALKDTVQLQHKDVESLKERLSVLNSEHFAREQKLERFQRVLEEKIMKLTEEVFKLENERDAESNNLASLKEKYNTVDIERQQACGALHTAYSELKIANDNAELGERARAEVDKLNREVILMGELNLKYQERLSELEKTKEIQAQLEMQEANYQDELRHLKSRIDNSRGQIEAYKQKTIDLENILTEKDESISQLKRHLMEAKAENHERNKAVESKLQTQLAITRALEQKMLQLYTKIEQPGPRNLYSPETSSCHEAIPSASISGLSPHSSPLSVSLASSESSTAFLSSDIKDMRNLQVLVDRKAGKLEDVECAGDSMEMYQPSTSGTQQQSD